jgi:apyrase
MEVGYYIRWLGFELRKSWKLSLAIISGFVLIFLMLASSTSSQAIYKVVLDAGSTGTRVHVFHFKSPKFTLRNYEVSEADLDLIAIPLFTKIDGGLSRFAENPKACQSGLVALIKQAKAVVPEELWPETEVILMATAGLRLLKPEQAEALLAEARSVLSQSGFKLGMVDTIDGKLEAKFMFMMTHFVSNHNDEKKMAIVDLGGGSVQLAYKAGQDMADLHPSVAKEVENYLDRSKRSTLYLHSWLGYGLVAFRLKALEMMEQGKPHPCVPQWTPPDTSYRYGDREVAVIPRNSQDAVMACVDLIRQAINTNLDGEKCKLISMETLSQKTPTQCGLTGSWLGPSEPNSISEWRLYSYIFDLAQAEGLVTASQSEAALSAKDFMKAAEVHCVASHTPPNTNSDELQWWKCIDLVYVYALLTDGFKLDPNFPLKVTKHLSYKGEIELEAAWPLGAAIAAIKSEL